MQQEFPATSIHSPKAPANDSITVMNTMTAPTRARVMAEHVMMNTKANVASIMMMMSLAE